MLKYINSNIDHCLACVANDLESSNGDIAYKQMCLFTGLIILTGFRPGQRATRGSGDGSAIGFIAIRNNDIILSKSLDGQNDLTLTFFAKNLLFTTSIVLHDPIFITSIDEMKKTKKKDDEFFDTVEYNYAKKYLQSMINGVRLKDLRTYKASYSAFCTLEALKEILASSERSVLQRFRSNINKYPIVHGRNLFRLLFKHIVDFMGHKSYLETLEYIDPDILFLILAQFSDRENSLIVLHALIPHGIMQYWVDEDMTLEKCQVCLDYYKIPKLIEIYNKIPITLIENIFN
jgi:hypothetical protein